MDPVTVVIPRSLTTIPSRFRLAVPTKDGEMHAGTFSLPRGIQNRQQIRLSTQQLVKEIPGDHEWPDDGVVIQARVRSRWLVNLVVLASVVAGFIGGAPGYAGLLFALWLAIVLCISYRDRRTVDQFDPKTRGFWLTFRITLAGTAVLYLVMVCAVLVCYLDAAFVFRFQAAYMIAPQLIGIQRSLSAVSAFYDRWIKLDETTMFGALAIVWLVNCLLLTGTRYPHTRADIAAPPYRLARALNRAMAFYGRYSGPAAAVLAVLASFTFLSTTSDSLGTQLHLRAVASTQDYRYAARRVEADLSDAVVRQLASDITNALPVAYQQALRANPWQTVTTIQQDMADLVDDALPAGEASHVTAEENATSRAGDAPDNPERVTAADENDSPDVAGDPDLTTGQIADARAAIESDPTDEWDKVLDDSGRELLFQVEKVASAPAWNSLKAVVTRWFPIAGPLVDALADACDERLQDLVREQVPDLVTQVATKTTDIQASIGDAATRIVADVNVSALVREYGPAASTSATHQQAALHDLSDQTRSLLSQDVVTDIIGSETDTDQITSDGHIEYSITSAKDAEYISEVTELSDPALQQDIVARLRTMMHTPQEPDRAIGAQAIEDLGPSVAGVTQADLAYGQPYCGCSPG